MDYRMMVLDIDGTVNNSQKEVTPKTKEALWRLQEKGVMVAVASGRPPMGVAPVADILKLDQFGSYILGFNGARIIDWRSKECVYEKTLALHMPRKLIEDCSHWGLGMLTYDETHVIALTRQDRYMEIEAKINRVSLTFPGNPEEVLQVPVNKCLLTGEPQNVATAEEELAEKYRHEAEVFRSEPYFLEVTPKHVDKAYCLSRLLEILKISREQVICVGDGYNDISMLQFAGVGVAMANAQMPVKAIADDVTRRDNDHDGVAEVVEKYFGISV